VVLGQETPLRLALPAGRVFGATDHVVPFQCSMNVLADEPPEYQPTASHLVGLEHAMAPRSVESAPA
jgi:hypothetical protein